MTAEAAQPLKHEHSGLDEAQSNAFQRLGKKPSRRAGLSKKLRLT
jgi:hypothetical protein